MMDIQETLRHYGLVIRHHLGTILCGVVLCSVVTCVVSLWLPPVYQASALIRVNDAPTSAGGNVFSAQAQAISYALLVTRSDVLQRAARQLPGISAEQLAGDVSDAPVDNTQIIEVQARANDPHTAANIANIVSRAFIDLQEANETTRLQQLSDQVSQELISARSNSDAAQQQLTTLTNAHASEAQLAQQKSQLDSDQSSYTTLLAGYGQLQTQQLQIQNILILAQAASPPTQPLSPLIALNTAMAACISLLCMSVLVLLTDWLDITIKTSEDVERLAGLPSLGTIPVSTFANPDTLLQDMTREGEEEAQIAYELLGTRLQQINKKTRSLLITGMHGGTGVSTTALYLAKTLARAGTRVLLVDTNFYHPRQHDIFMRPNITGLADCINEVAILQNRLQTLSQSWLLQWKTQIHNLWLIPAGPPPTNGMAVLRKPELQQLLRWLLDQNQGAAEGGLVDMVIFDAPSLEEPAISALAALVDATIMVVAAGKVHPHKVLKFDHMLQQLGTSLLGVVVNFHHKWHRPYFYVRHAMIEKNRVPERLPLEQQPTRDLQVPATNLFDHVLPVQTPPVQTPQPSLPSTTPITPLPDTPLRAPETPLPLSLPVQTLILPAQPGPSTRPIGGTTEGTPRRQFAPLLRPISVNSLNTGDTQR